MLNPALSAPRALPILVLVALAACASRRSAASYPANAPASAQATEARTVTVTRALASDPPLPGERRAGWRGLDEGGEPTHAHGAHHAGHGQHEGHTMPMQHEGHTMPMQHEGHTMPPAEKKAPAKEKPSQAPHEHQGHEHQGHEHHGAH